MEFCVPRNDLAAAVTHAVHGIPSNPLQPVRAGMRIETQGGIVIFSGSDGDVTFNAAVSRKFGEDSVIIVPGKLLADIVRTLPDKDVTLTTDDAGMILSCGRIQFKFPVYKETYPELPEPAVKGVNLDSDVFSDAVRKVIPAASKAMNPVLSSVYLEADGNTFYAVCTDKCRLAAVRMTLGVPVDPAAVLVPSWAAEKFTRGAEGTMTLGWDDRVITMESGVTQVTSRVIDGEFPKTWRNLLPSQPCIVEVATEDLQGALRRAQLASEADSPVELTFTTGCLHVEAGYGNHADDILDASYTGAPFRALFGIGFLSDGLAGCGPVVSFGWTDPLKPVWLTSGAYTYTVLPRRRI